MRSLALTVLCCIGLVSLPGIALQPVFALEVVTGEGAVVACVPAPAGTPVTLSFTHSMFGGFVRESYVVTPDGALQRQRVVTEHASAAEYYATDGRIQKTPQGFEVLAGPFITGDLVVRVDQRGNHRLTVGTSRYHLARMLPGSTQVHIGTIRGCR